DLYILCRPVSQILQFLRLPSVQSRRDCEGCIHAYDSGIEIEFRDTLETSCGTFFDAHAATFTVVDQNLVESVRPLGPRDARLGTDQVTVVTSIASTATETTIGF